MLGAVAVLAIVAAVIITIVMNRAPEVEQDDGVPVSDIPTGPNRGFDRDFHGDIDEEWDEQGLE